jgi:hypothetical protein
MKNKNKSPPDILTKEAVMSVLALILGFFYTAMLLVNSITFTTLVIMMIILQKTGNAEGIGSDKGTNSSNGNRMKVEIESK